MIGDILGLTGAALNYFGARQANEMNRRMAREQMAFQQGSNREQMAFQERMSNTAYQRAVQDMRAAGINPILAFQQGGASTPAGSSAQGAMAHSKNEFSGAVSSALQAMALKAQIDQTKATTDLLKADLSQKSVEAEIYSGRYGRLLKVLQMLSSPTNSATGLMRLFK